VNSSFRAVGGAGSRDWDDDIGGLPAKQAGGGHYSAEPPLVLLDITAEDWSAALCQAPSLTALLAQLPERGWLFG
jgi:hypothetical protein